MPYFQLKVRNVHPKKLDRCTEKKQGGKGTAAGRAFEKGHLSSFDRSNDQQKKTTGLSMPQTRKMNSKKKRPCTRRSAGCSPLCCTPTTPPSLHTFPARSCKPATSSFYLISFQIPSQTCDFPLDGKVSRQIKLKTKKKPFVKILPATLVPTGIPITRYVSPACALFLFLVLPPFPQRKGNRSNVGSDPIAK